VQPDLVFIGLTSEEINELLQLMDAGLKNQQGGGLRRARIAALIMQKLDEAGQRQKLNGAGDQHEGEEIHG
jgi:hypothetical protein